MNTSGVLYGFYDNKMKVYDFIGLFDDERRFEHALVSSLKSALALPESKRPLLVLCPHDFVIYKYGFFDSQTGNIEPKITYVQSIESFMSDHGINALSPAPDSENKEGDK